MDAPNNAVSRGNKPVGHVGTVCVQQNLELFRTEMVSWVACSIGYVGLGFKGGTGMDSEDVC